MMMRAVAPDNNKRMTIWSSATEGQPFQCQWHVKMHSRDSVKWLVIGRITNRRKYARYGMYAQYMDSVRPVSYYLSKRIKTVNKNWQRVERRFQSSLERLFLHCRQPFQSWWNDKFYSIHNLWNDKLHPRHVKVSQFFVSVQNDANCNNLFNPQQQR